MFMWFAIRVTYSRELKFCKALNEAGFETFVPMKRKKVEKNGVTSHVMVPAVSNLCFVNTEKPLLDEYMSLLGEANPAHYIWNKATKNPIIVPDKAMADFIQISKVMADEVLYLQDVTSKLQAGQKVRVKEGPFKGIEGVVIRVKRSRRVVVDFPGLLAVATSYIDPRELELI
jgi:transcription antitermination factor NusG